MLRLALLLVAEIIIESYQLLASFVCISTLELQIAQLIFIFFMGFTKLPFPRAAVRAFVFGLFPVLNALHAINGLAIRAFLRLLHDIQADLTQKILINFFRNWLYKPT